jgi:hypothetical protein
LLGYRKESSTLETNLNTGLASRNTMETLIDDLERALQAELEFKAINTNIVESEASSR